MKTRIAAVLLAALALAAPASAQVRADGTRPSIAVTGEALVTATPDKILVTLGIETWDANVLVAKERNGAILGKALAAMRALGVADKDVQTDHLSIEPRWKDDYRHDTFIGFFVRNGLVVTLTQVATVERLLTSVLEAGVNYVHDVDFQTTDFRRLRDRARELALGAAREKATAMAAVLGQSIGPPLQISESYAGSPWSYSSSWGGWRSSRAQGMSQNVVQATEVGAGATGETVALGKIAIRAAVSVTFELKQP
jgi:uncharacterized protein